MKKSLIAISTAALALCLASVPLVGCGGNSGGGATTGDAPAAVKEDKKTDFGLYKVEVPDGWEVKLYDTVAQGEFRMNPDNDSEIIKISYESGTAQEEFDDSIGYWKDKSDPHTDGGTVTIGKYTYLVENFTWNDKPSVTLYTDAPDGNGSIEINVFMKTHEDPAVKSFLEDIEFAEDCNAGWQKAYEITEDTLDIK